MAVVSTTSNANLLKAFWNEVFVNELRESMVFYDLGLKSTVPDQSGTLEHWLTIADLSADPVARTQGTDPTEYSLSSGDMTATVKQYGDFVKLSDVFMDTAINGTMEHIMERLGRHAAKTMDIVIRDAVLSASTVVKYGGTAVARNSLATDGSFDFTVATLRKAKNFLSKANAMPLRGTEFVAVAHPDVVYDLEGDANWVNAHLYTEKGISGIYDGEVGKLYGVRFIENTNALAMVASGSASTDVYQTYFVGQEGFGVGEFRQVKTIVDERSMASPLRLYGTAGWKTQFATRELQASAMVRYETGASLGA